MNPLYIALTVVLALACLCMITAILLQKKRDAGFSGEIAGQGAGGADKTHFDRNKKRTREGQLERATKILATVFMVLSLVISLMA